MLRTRATTLHPEAVAWAKVATGNGGTLTTNHLRAVSKFCCDIDRAGIRSRFVRLNLMIGSNLAACLTPLYRGPSRTGNQYGFSTDTNHGPFVAADYGPAVGLTGNGASKWLDTGLTLGGLVTAGVHYDNAHASVYSRVSSAGPHLGAWDTGDFSTAYVLYDNGVQMQFYCGDPFGDAVAQGTRSSLGLMTGNRLDSANDFSVRVNNANVTFSTTNNYQNDFDWSSDPSSPVPVFALYEANTSGFVEYAASTLASYSIGTAFTSSAEFTAFNAAVAAFQSAMGRVV